MEYIILLTINFSIGFLFGIAGFLYGLAIFSGLAVFLNMYFAAKQLKEKTIWFAKMVVPYVVLSVLLVLILLYLFKLLGIYSHYYHLLLTGLSFTACYYFFSLLFKFKGFEIFILELKNMQLFGKIKIKTKNIFKNSD